MTFNLFSPAAAQPARTAVGSGCHLSGFPTVAAQRVVVNAGNVRPNFRFRARNTVGGFRRDFTSQSDKHKPLSVKAAAGGTVTGVLNVTLEDLGKLLTGAVAVQGISAPTLEALGVLLAGKVEVRGSAPITLGELVATLAGTVAVKGDLAKTLDDLAATLSGKVPVSAALGQVLADALLSASGAVAVQGQLAQVLAPLTGVVTGTVTPAGGVISGSLDLVLEDISAEISGTVVTPAVAAARIIPWLFMAPREPSVIEQEDEELLLLISALFGQRVYADR